MTVIAFGAVVLAVLTTLLMLHKRSVLRRDCVSNQWIKDNTYQKDGY